MQAEPEILISDLKLVCANSFKVPSTVNRGMRGEFAGCNRFSVVTRPQTQITKDLGGDANRQYIPKTAAIQLFTCGQLELKPGEDDYTRGLVEQFLEELGVKRENLARKPRSLDSVHLDEGDKQVIRLLRRGEWRKYSSASTTCFLDISRGSSLDARLGTLESLLHRLDREGIISPQDPFPIKSAGENHGISFSLSDMAALGIEDVVKVC